MESSACSSESGSVVDDDAAGGVVVVRAIGAVASAHSASIRAGLLVPAAFAAFAVGVAVFGSVSQKTSRRRSRGDAAGEEDGEGDSTTKPLATKTTKSNSSSSSNEEEGKGSGGGEHEKRERRTARIRQVCGFVVAGVVVSVLALPCIAAGVAALFAAMLSPSTASASAHHAARSALAAGLLLVATCPVAADAPLLALLAFGHASSALVPCAALAIASAALAGPALAAAPLWMQPLLRALAVDAAGIGTPTMLLAAGDAAIHACCVAAAGAAGIAAAALVARRSAVPSFDLLVFRRVAAAVAVLASTIAIALRTADFARAAASDSPALVGTDTVVAAAIAPIAFSAIVAAVAMLVAAVLARFASPLPAALTLCVARPAAGIAALGVIATPRALGPAQAVVRADAAAFALVLLVAAVARLRAARAARAKARAEEAAQRHAARCMWAVDVIERAWLRHRLVLAIKHPARAGARAQQQVPTQKTTTTRKKKRRQPRRLLPDAASASASASAASSRSPLPPVVVRGAKVPVPETTPKPRKSAAQRLLSQEDGGSAITVELTSTIGAPRRSQQLI